MSEHLNCTFLIPVLQSLNNEVKDKGHVLNEMLNAERKVEHDIVQFLLLAHFLPHVHNMLNDHRQQGPEFIHVPLVLLQVGEHDVVDYFQVEDVVSLSRFKQSERIDHYFEQIVEDNGLQVHDRLVLRVVIWPFRLSVHKSFV